MFRQSLVKTLKRCLGYQRLHKTSKKETRCMTQCTDFVEMNGTGDNRTRRRIIGRIRSGEGHHQCIGNIGGRHEAVGRWCLGPMKASHVTDMSKF
jgi:hypothetical protein